MPKVLTIRKGGKGSGFHSTSGHAGIIGVQGGSTYGGAAPKVLTGTAKAKHEDYKAQRRANTAMRHAIELARRAGLSEADAQAKGKEAWDRTYLAWRQSNQGLAAEANPEQAAADAAQYDTSVFRDEHFYNGNLQLASSQEIYEHSDQTVKDLADKTGLIATDAATLTYIQSLDQEGIHTAAAKGNKSEYEVWLADKGSYYSRVTQLKNSSKYMLDPRDLAEANTRYSNNYYLSNLR